MIHVRMTYFILACLLMQLWIAEDKLTVVANTEMFSIEQHHQK